MSEMKIDAAAPTQREKTVRVTAGSAVVCNACLLLTVHTC